MKVWILLGMVPVLSCATSPAQDTKASTDEGARRRIQALLKYSEPRQQIREELWRAGVVESFLAYEPHEPLQSRLRSLLEEEEAVIALGAEAVPALIDALQSTTHAPVRIRLIGLLGLLGDKRAEDELFLQATAKVGRETRRAALRAIGRIGNPASVPRIQKLQDSGFPTQETSWALGSCGKPESMRAFVDYMAGKARECRHPKGAGAVLNPVEEPGGDTPPGKCGTLEDRFQLLNDLINLGDVHEVPALEVLVMFLGYCDNKVKHMAWELLKERVSADIAVQSEAHCLALHEGKVYDEWRTWLAGHGKRLQWSGAKKRFVVP